MEKESDVLGPSSMASEIVSSEIAQTEVIRAVARRHAGLAEAAEDLLADIGLVAVNTVVTMAGGVDPPPALRSLDALHVASARRLEGDLAALVTYDRRMIDAARMAGLPVASPGASAA